LGLSSTGMRLGLELVHRTGLGRLSGRVLARAGVIFALHRVKPKEAKAFAPNQLLEVTPEFLEETIKTVRGSGFDIVSLDEGLARLANGASRPFACFTFDDAYRDNKDFALPVLERCNVPFTVYVPEHFADGTGQIWWVELERAIEVAATVAVPHLFPGETLSCGSAEEKTQTFNRIYWRLRRMDEVAARRIVRHVCTKAGLDVTGLCRELIMPWEDLRGLAHNPLARLGAHTIGHFAVAKLHPAEALHEMKASKARVEAETGQPCQHICYPYGDAGSAGPRDFVLAKQAGFKSGVTMRKGLIEPRHKNALLSLPRCSLNGAFQNQGYVEALLSGLPFALWNTLVERPRQLASGRALSYEPQSWEGLR